MADEKKDALAQKNPVLEKINAGKANLIARLPKGIDRDRFFLGIMTAIQRSKAVAPPGKSLADCDPNSVLLAAFDAAEVGCSLSPSLQLGWLIPYGKEANFQPSYRFFIQKAYETKEVKTFFAEVVYSSDEFTRQLAPKKNLFHAPGTGARTKEQAIGAYALIEFTDETVDYEYLTAEQIKRHRDHSKQPNSLMWTSFWEEGWRKTPIRVIAKRLPLKNRDFEGLVEMINKDTERDLISVDDVATIQATAPPRRLSETEAPPPIIGENADRATQMPQAQQKEPAKEEAKPTNGGKNAPAQAPQAAGAMFSEEDPFLSGAEIKEFWDRVMAAGWKKPEVVPHLSAKFQVTSVKDLRQSQLKGVLAEFESPEPGADG